MEGPVWSVTLAQRSRTIFWATERGSGTPQGSQTPLTSQAWRRLVQCTATAAARDRTGPTSASEGCTRVTRTPPGWSFQPPQSTIVLPKNFHRTGSLFWDAGGEGEGWGLGWPPQSQEGWPVQDRWRLWRPLSVAESGLRPWQPAFPWPEAGPWLQAGGWAGGLAAGWAAGLALAVPEGNRSQVPTLSWSGFTPGLAFCRAATEVP